jgi:3-oxoacyl-[acyl-carrier protein] reductase
VVTGASSGIGRAIVERVGRDGFGVVANVFDCSDEPDLAAEPSPGPVITRAGDMTREVDAIALVDTALERFGRVDLLVNNAGGGRIQPFTSIGLADWRHLLDSNLTTAFVVTRAVVPHMIERSRGRIVNIASQQAFKGAPKLAHYCAAKAGVIGLTRALALELAEHGITVNAVAPGPIDTGGHARAGVAPDALMAQIAALPLRRLGTPGEVAESVAFLASSPAGDFYTGQTLHPNGGDVMP